MWRIRHILTDMQLDVSKMEIRKFKFGEEYGDSNTPYRRVWTKPITTYAENYNKFDFILDKDTIGENRNMMLDYMSKD